ncbi:MAG TPA: beta-ketoacyl-[acyl-carrier-protein] synthase family protein [Bryobacteraceae bacterium]|nr:beta-ketoacyl-[acyl-carrier-protein] synthase family protein [Bryobacteraceae bacterium]
MTPRVVVTGAGVISPLGAGIDAFADALWNGASSIQPSTRFPGTVASEFAEFNPTPWLGNKGVRVLDRGTRFLCVAAQMALSATGLPRDATGEGDADLGLVCGTLFGGVHSIATFDWSGLTEGPALVSPMEFPNTVINAPAGQAAIKHKLRGVNSTICAGLSSGLYAIQHAAEFLRFGRAKYLMAGGMEEVCDEASLGFRKLNLASPTGQVKPFGTERDGTAAGEGSALWMMETEETANSRGAKPLFEILGFGAAHDAREMMSYSVRAEGATSAITQALEETGIGSDDIGCIVAGANGSRTGDAMEAYALRNVFGDRLAKIPVSAPKAATGEAMGASGAFCALTAGLALERQQVPPTAGFTCTDSGLRLSADAQPFFGEYALINAFSCDGNNAALVIRLWKN